MSPDNSSSLFVEELEGFPFRSFSDFRTALHRKEITLGVDRSVALLWVQPQGKARHAPPSIRFKVFLLSLLSYLAVIGFTIFVVMKTSWLWLLALPIFLVAFFVFHPSTDRLISMTCPLGQFALFAITTVLWFGVLWGLATGTNGLTALAASLVIQRYAIKRVYSVAVESIIDAASASEDLLCRLWRLNAIRIVFSNGDSFSRDHVSRGQQTNMHQKPM